MPLSLHLCLVYILFTAILTTNASNLYLNTKFHLGSRLTCPNVYLDVSHRHLRTSVQNWTHELHPGRIFLICTILPAPTPSLGPQSPRPQFPMCYQLPMLLVPSPKPSYLCPLLCNITASHSWRPCCLSFVHSRLHQLLHHKTTGPGCLPSVTHCSQGIERWYCSPAVHSARLLLTQQKGFLSISQKYQTPSFLQWSSMDFFPLALFLFTLVPLASSLNLEVISCEGILQPCLWYWPHLQSHSYWWCNCFSASTPSLKALPTLFTSILLHHMQETQQGFLRMTKWMLVQTGFLGILQLLNPDSRGSCKVAEVSPNVTALL